MTFSSELFGVDDDQMAPTVDDLAGEEALACCRRSGSRRRTGGAVRCLWPARRPRRGRVRRRRRDADSSGRYFEVERQSVLMSGCLGSIGFVLPAALGVWAAVGDRGQIVAVAGDGGFGQYAMEMITAVGFRRVRPLVRSSRRDRCVQRRRRRRTARRPVESWPGTGARPRRRRTGVGRFSPPASRLCAGCRC